MTHEERAEAAYMEIHAYQTRQQGMLRTEPDPDKILEILASALRAAADEARGRVVIGACEHERAFAVDCQGRHYGSLLPGQSLAVVGP